MWMPTLNRRPQCGPLTKNVFLPHKLIQAPRAHPHRQGHVCSWNAFGEGLFAVEQPVCH